MPNSTHRMAKLKPPGTSQCSTTAATSKKARMPAVRTTSPVARSTVFTVRLVVGIYLSMYWPDGTSLASPAGRGVRRGGSGSTGMAVYTLLRLFHIAAYGGRKRRGGILIDAIPTGLGSNHCHGLSYR